MIGKIILFSVLGLIALFLIVVISRALAFKPKKEETVEAESVKIDEEKVIKNLQEMVKIPTVSDMDASKEDAKAFKDFEELFKKLFPNVIKACEYIPVEGRAMLYKWKGKSDLKPTVLMAHFDVVSVNEEQWEKPAFEGIIEDGVLWGRGTLDTKGTLNGAASAVDQLISEGFIPENDIYLAFSGNEEINGEGAPSIVRYFQSKNITPELVVDEGGAIVNDVFPGVTSPCAVVGIAEKGMLNLKYTIDGNGGHASAPPSHTLVGKLSEACVKVENKPFKFKLTEPAKAMFDTLGRHSSFVYRMIFANLWCFAPVLNALSKKKGGELNALMRTTVAFTQMQGSKGMNVMPPHVEMLSNLRLICGETQDSAMAYIQKIVGDEVKLSTVSGFNPSRVSKLDCDSYKKVKEAIGATWSDALVSPYLMVACSDSRHYGVISDKVYRFSAMRMTKEERGTIHGNNERIKLENIVKAVEFYYRLIKSV